MLVYIPQTFIDAVEEYVGHIHIRDLMETKYNKQWRKAEVNMLFIYNHTFHTKFVFVQEITYRFTFIFIRASY